MTPIELIKERLDEYEKALRKSKEAFLDGRIDLKTHDTHLKNLEPKIKKYRIAYNILELALEIL